jgi:ApaG protein
VAPVPATTTSEAVTRGIRVTVRARFSEQNSDAQARQWVFLYTITVRNEGAPRVQLLTRHWIITDANGEIEEVKGPGVVGKQPILEPGHSFEYTSACPLKTPFGSMHGSYQMLGPGNETFDVQIAGFALRMPGTMQ